MKKTVNREPSTVNHLRKRKLAIFDIDGTIYRWSLFIDLVYELIREGVFPQKAYDRMLKSYLRWLSRKIAYEQYIKLVIEIYYIYLKGCNVSDMERAVGRIMTRKKDRVYRFTRDLIADLKKKDYFLLAISGSPDYIVKDFADYFGFDAYFGTQFEVKKGRFTGHVLNIDSAIYKEKVLKTFFKKYPNTFDSKEIIGVGDTETDIPILAMVGRPIAFNPNMKLAKVAKRKRWRVVVERKDVIYEVKNFVFVSK